MPRWTTKPFAEEVPRLLKEQGVSLRALARSVGVSDAHLSRILRSVGSRRASGELARRVAVALGVPPDYFPEYREAFVIDRIRHDPGLRDRFYRRLRPSK